MNKDEALRYIDAYVDDELGVKDTLEVQAWIGRDAECRAEFERIVALKRALKERMGREEEAHVPDLLRRRVLKVLRRERWRQNYSFRSSLAAAAGIVLLLVGWTAYNRTMVMPSRLVADTIMIYRVEIQNPLDFRSGDIQKVASWLNERFQQEVKPIEFQKGELLGVRLCPFAGKKGAFVRYRVNGRNMALFIGESKSIPYSLPMVPSFRMAGQDVFAAENEGFQLAFWKRGMWFYALVVEDAIGREDLKNIFSQSSFF